MANTLPVITLTNIDWENANNITGIAVGTSVDIQNQSSGSIMVAISPTKPDITFRGFIIPPDTTAVATVAAGESIVWLIGEGPVSVQVV